MKASIIIPTSNRAKQLFQCIKTLVELDLECRDYEIIIIDNGSKDNTQDVVREYIKRYPSHNINYFYDGIPGLLTGRHRGAKEAKSDILVFIDDDIYVDQGWLTAVVETFNRYPEVHLVGGKCLPKYEVQPPVWLEYFWNYLEDGGEVLPALSLSNLGEVEKEIHPHLIFGLNFSIRKTALYELGGFRPDCVPPMFQHLQGDGETGLSTDAFVKGYKALYQPKALVYHDVPADRMTLSYFDKRYFYQGVCNSYTDIRRNNGIKDLNKWLIIKREVKSMLRSIYGNSQKQLSVQSETNFEKEMLITRFRSMESAGYTFHQEVAAKNPVIMQWILKENYWDYSIPSD